MGYGQVGFLPGAGIKIHIRRLLKRIVVKNQISDEQKVEEYYFKENIKKRELTRSIL